MYASFDERTPLNDHERSFTSINVGTNKLIINAENGKEKEKLYFVVDTLEKAEIIVEAKMIQKVNLTLNEKINFKLSDVSTIFIPTKNITAKKVFIYITSEIIFNCNIDLKYEINKRTKTFQVTQKYQNGKGVIIPMSEIEDRENGNFILSITTNEEYKERKVEV